MIAENQRDIAEQLEDAQVAINLGDALQLLPNHISEGVEMLIEDLPRRQIAVKSGRKLVDGHGAVRCVHRLLNVSGPTDSCE